MPVASRTFPAPTIRHATAKRLARGMVPAVEKVIRRQVREAASRVRGGYGAVPADHATRWAEELLGAFERRALGVMAIGCKMARAEVESILGKAVDLEDVLQVAGGGIDTEVLQPVMAKVQPWLKDAASQATKTNAAKIQKVFDKALTTWDPVKRQGMTPAQMAKEIERLSPKFVKTRARLIANTTTQYSFNAGAKAGYVSQGVRVLEWWTSQDDAVCPFCGQMHGVRVASSDPFWPADSTFGVEMPDGGVRTLDLPSAVEHPPLHPNCGCVLLPVIAGPIPIPGLGEMPRAKPRPVPRPKPKRRPVSEPVPEPVQEPGAWQEAKTLEDAKEQLRGTLSSTAIDDYGFKTEVQQRLLLKRLNAIGEDWARVRRENPQLDALIAKFKKGWLRGLSVDSAEHIGRRVGHVLGNVKGHYNTSKRTVLVGSGKTTTKTILQVGKREWMVTGDSLPGLVRHELGHAVQGDLRVARLLREGKIKQRWAKIHERLHRARELEKISALSLPNESESFAECFSAFTSSKYRPGMLPDYIEDWLTVALRTGGE